MVVAFGREICNYLNSSECREWLITNGIGGYGAGTVSGMLTRRYHGLMIAALNPPLNRTLLLTKLDETVGYDGQFFPIYTNRWADGKVDPEGFKHIQHFRLEGTIPVWDFACGDALLEKRIWMRIGENTTYVKYTLLRATKAMSLSIKVMVNHRDHHYNTHGNNANNFQIDIKWRSQGVEIRLFPDANPLYLFTQGSGEEEVMISRPGNPWHYGYDLAMERYRGMDWTEDHLHACTLHTTLTPGRALTVIASTKGDPNLDIMTELEAKRQKDRVLLEYKSPPVRRPDWISQLILAADQFIVDRTLKDGTPGKTIIAGYPWFGDWGRDTMISLPGLTLSTGRPDIARTILQTFSHYVDGGMLPNRFPEVGETPDYNTVDATLWYWDSIRAYFDHTLDIDLLAELFPVLDSIIDWHHQGTRYNIKVDPEDGLLYAGEPGSQLTWMDAKVGDWVVTPRVGKPIEVNALWYHALQIMIRIAKILDKPSHDYETWAKKTAEGFSRFWNPQTGYCYDVLDTPEGNDPSLRPNQIFAISLPQLGKGSYSCLLTRSQQRQVVDICSQKLLTSYGLRSLSPEDAKYQGVYGGDQLQRDGAYHQGTAWGWLQGPFALAHFYVYGDRSQAQSFLEPMADHLNNHGLGTLSEIFDGDPPMSARGCFAQAWTVAEVLRAWFELESDQRV